MVTVGNAERSWIGKKHWKISKILKNNIKHHNIF